MNFGLTFASFRRRCTTSGVTPKRAATSSMPWPASISCRNASNSSAGCIASRVLGKRDLHCPLLTHDQARHRVIGRDAPALQEPPERAPSPAARDHAEAHPLIALAPRALVGRQILQHAFSSNEFRELID